MSKLTKEDEKDFDKLYKKYLKHMPRGLIHAWKAIVISMMQSILYDLSKEQFQELKKIMQKQIDYIQSAINDLDKIYADNKEKSE